MDVNLIVIIFILVFLGLGIKFKMIIDFQLDLRRTWVALKILKSELKKKRLISEQPPSTAAPAGEERRGGLILRFSRSSKGDSSPVIIKSEINNSRVNISFFVIFENYNKF